MSRKRRGAYPHWFPTLHVLAWFFARSGNHPIRNPALPANASSGLLQRLRPEAGRDRAASSSFIGSCDDILTAAAEPCHDFTGSVGHHQGDCVEGPGDGVEYGYKNPLSTPCSSLAIFIHSDKEPSRKLKPEVRKQWPISGVRRPLIRLGINSCTSSQHHPLILQAGPGILVLCYNHCSAQTLIAITTSNTCRVKHTSPPIQRPHFGHPTLTRDQHHRRISPHPPLHTRPGPRRLPRRCTNNNPSITHTPSLPQQPPPTHPCTCRLPSPSPSSATPPLPLHPPHPAMPAPLSPPTLTAAPPPTSTATATG
ncbi:hypothetical protein VTK26DRAFT_5622 [Humicola hyalothermophila]